VSLLTANLAQTDTPREGRCRCSSHGAIFLRVVGGQPAFGTHPDKYVVAMRRQVSGLLHITIAHFFSEITVGERAQIALDIRGFSRDDGALDADVLVRRTFRLYT
jgi:hypothetical protein